MKLGSAVTAFTQKEPSVGGSPDTILRIDKHVRTWRQIELPAVQRGFVNLDQLALKSGRPEKTVFRMSPATGIWKADRFPLATMT